MLLFALVLLAGCNLSVGQKNTNQIIAPSGYFDQPAVFNFSASGNLAKNNPGQKPDVWYLVYEEPGAPGLTVELQFDNNSSCITSTTTVPCATIMSNDYFQSGEKVSIKGTKKDSVVLVSELTVSNAPATSGAKTITLDNNNTAIKLKVGGTFLLNLGATYNWNVQIDNQNVVSREVNILVINGAQGIYRAKESGKAVLSAVGDPLCRQSNPACAAPSLLFKLNIEVIN